MTRKSMSTARKDVKTTKLVFSDHDIRVRKIYRLVIYGLPLTLQKKKDIVIRLITVTVQHEVLNLCLSNSSKSCRCSKELQVT